MTRRDFLMMVPLLTFPAVANAGDWLYPIVFARNSYGLKDVPMVDLYFVEETDPRELSLANTPRLELRLRGRLEELTGRVHRLGDADNPIFSGLAWLGPRVARQLTAAAVRIDRLDAEKLTVGFIEAERVGWKGRAENLTGTVLPSPTRTNPKS